MKKEATKNIAILRKKNSVSKKETIYRRIEIVKIRTSSGIKTVSSNDIDAAWNRIVRISD
ncbi:hypothetical protein HMPREF2983_12685 [Prevotella sp. HMSC077E09]|uniref:hypothetical protein n=1 Tax=Prevotella sp. HMSC077E09 TaxID=1739487 RepID=UPI0008A3A3C0|nr:MULTISPECIES: hypothetical protein [unclassified Prevotella]OFO80266.1 hypothetical protein HMPREF3018_00570 [Prevotella sp. HMSC077E08]OFP50229.1 hypothetical protein HMPREF2983_12685 [Prevotella sp. HMSC077E09]